MLGSNDLPLTSLSALEAAAALACGVEATPLLTMPFCAPTAAETQLERANPPMGPTNALPHWARSAKAKRREHFISLVCDRLFRLPFLSPCRSMLSKCSACALCPVECLTCFFGGVPRQPRACRPLRRRPIDSPP